MRIALAGHDLWPGGHSDDDGVVDALRVIGIDAPWAVWDDDSVDWARFDAVVIRQTWDYPDKVDRFLAWVDAVAAATVLVNPAPVVRWNVHKGYLLDLAAAGVPIVPTTLVPAGSPVPADLPWAEAVVKPAVGVGGNDVERAAGGGVGVAGQDLLVQPYLASVETAGETSIIVLAGEPSHGVVKVPAPGEHRAHEHRGGTYRPVDPRDDQLEVARAAWKAAVERTGETPAFGRVDLLDDADGRPLLGELELIEPSLYLHHVPEAIDRLATAISDRTRRRRRE